MIKNYTTTVSANQTVSEIEAILVKHGARGIAKQYDLNGNIEAVVFSIQSSQGELAFKLPCKFEKLHKRLLELRKKQLINIPWGKLNNNTHAINVGWRIIKDWIDAQLSLIQIEMVELNQVFLPYAYNRSTDQTLYETLKEDGFKYLQ